MVTSYLFDTKPAARLNGGTTRKRGQPDRSPEGTLQRKAQGK